MKIQFNDQVMHLSDEPLDIGYASERVSVTAADGTKQEIGGFTKTTQLLLSLPYLDDAISKELSYITQTLQGSALIDASILLVFADLADTQQAAKEGYTAFCDSEEEFGDMYGTRLADGPLEGKLTKALFVISKDGALFYDEFATDISRPFDADKALSKLAVAQECYTGKGCH